MIFGGNMKNFMRGATCDDEVVPAGVVLCPHNATSFGRSNVKLRVILVLDDVWVVVQKIRQIGCEWIA